MNITSKSVIRAASVVAVGVLLSACNTNKANDFARGGPQAVHPSPSALAQGSYVASQPTTYTRVPSCGAYGKSTCYAARGNDGSRPIID